MHMSTELPIYLSRHVKAYNTRALKGMPCTAHAPAHKQWIPRIVGTTIKTAVALGAPYQGFV